MEAIAALSSLLVVVALYASLAKVAARLYRRSKLSWKSALGFGALVALVLILGGAMVLVAGAVLGDVLPDVVKVVIGFGLLVGTGAWFLGPRATDAGGQALGLKAAAVLSTIAVGMAFALGMLLAIVLPVFGPR